MCVGTAMVAMTERNNKKHHQTENKTKTSKKKIESNRAILSVTTKQIDIMALYKPGRHLITAAWHTARTTIANNCRIEK
jgi:hypothetical protein